MRRLRVTPNAGVQVTHQRLVALLWPARSVIGATLLLCLAFFLAALVGLALHFPGSLVYFVWPPSAVVFVALLLSPPRWWWVYFLALFPVHLLVEWRTVAAPLGSLGLFYLVVWIQALAGALCVKRIMRRPFQLNSLRSLIVLLIGGAGVAALAEAVSLDAALALTSPSVNIWLSFLQGVLADALTMVILSPALLTGFSVAQRAWLAGGGPSGEGRWVATAGHAVTRRLRLLTRARVIEASSLALALLAVGLVAFGGYISLPGTLPALLYVVLPLLLWAAVRFGVGGTSLALCGLTLLAILYSIDGSGPFTTFSTTADLISLQLFFIAISAPLLVLAVIMQERQHAQVALEQSEERYRAVVRNFPNGAVLLFDGELRHRFADGQGIRNDSSLTHVAVGSTVWEAFPAAMAAHLAPRYQATLAGIPATFDVVANGRTYYIQTLPIRQTEGTAGMVVLQNVTEQRRAEALAELDRAKTVFFSNVSHELRTPLTLLLGPTVDALTDREEPLPPRQRERLELIEHSGKRLLKLVNTLLDFSRIEAGHIQATYEPTDLATLTAELAISFRSAIERAGLRLVVDCPPLTALPEPVYVDREMWEKIVFNLLSNAFKYTFAGAITVSLRPAGSGGQQGGQVELEVGDTGVGIPAEELPHLFERFYQGHAAQARSHEGTGIGLSLVWELVRLHSGAVRVTSTVGVGSRFIVTIPTGRAHLPVERLSDVHTGAARPMGPAGTAVMPTVFGAGAGTAPFVEEALRWLPDEPAPTAHAADRGASTRETQGEAGGEASDGIRGTRAPDAVARILLADDNADMRTYLTRLLGEHWTVEAVGDGIAALAAARARPPDLVLADIMMPSLDGLALAGALRADVATTAIPVLLLSARAGEEAIIEGLECGAVDYLVKPFAARELLARVRVHLELAGLRREAVEHAARLDAIFEAQTDGIAVFDTQGQFVQANRALSQILGYDPDSDYTTRPITHREQYVPLFDEAGQRIPIEQWPHWRVLRGEKLVGASAMDARLVTVDGREIWISITGAAVRRHDGQLTGAVLVTRDVTARRALEQQTQAQAGQLKAIFEALVDGIGVFDQQRRLVRANPAWQAILRQYADATGQSADPTFTALPLADQVSHLVLCDEHGHVIARGQRPTSRALRGETITGANAVDEWVYTPSGEAAVVYSVSAAPMRDLSGQITGAVTIVRDVTARRQLEVQVAEQAGQLEAIFRAMTDGVLVVDREGHVVRANRAWQHIFRGFTELSGMSREPGFSALPFAQQVNQWNVFYRLNKYLLRDGRDDAIPLEEIPIFRALRGETVNGANAADERVESADGHVYEFSVSAAPIRDATGNITGAVTVAHDVTAHRQLERQMREHIAQEATEAERARLARELHDTVTQELYSASLMAQTLPRLWTQQPGEVERTLGQLHEITKSGLATMRLLLVELRQDGLEEMRLPTLLQLLITAMHTRAGVPLSLDIAGDEESWFLLPREVKQAFYRIAQEAVTNAVKYAAANRIVVRLRRGRRGTLRLEVADDGVGFDPHASVPGHFGLTIMRERAKAVGARVRVASRAGQGTRVVIHWQETERAPEEPSAVHAPAKETVGEGSRS